MPRRRFRASITRSVSISPTDGRVPSRFPWNSRTPSSAASSAARTLTFSSMKGSRSSTTNIRRHILRCLVRRPAGKGHVVPSFRMPTLPVSPRRLTASRQYRLHAELVIMRSSGLAGPVYVLKGDVSNNSAAFFSFPWFLRRNGIAVGGSFATGPSIWPRKGPWKLKRADS